MSCCRLMIPRRIAAGVFFTLLFLSFTGCAPPVGQLSDSALELLVVPQRMVYNPGDLFQRDSDLSVFTSSNGILTPVNIATVDISIKEDPTRPDSASLVNGKYQLIYTGRKIIVLSYQGLTAEYSIEVRNLNGGNGGGGNVIIGDGSGSSLGNNGIKWVY